MVIDALSNKSRFYTAILLVTLIWALSLLQLLGFLNDFIPKLLPRHISGLPGIITMPFTHGSLIHLISNTFPLVVFSALISLKGNKYFLEVTSSIIILSGIMLWLMGRNSFHIGASGLVFGYFGFLLMRTYYSPSISTILISLGVFLLYGGIIFGILPQSGRISWEGHLFGFISGVIVARMMRRKI